MTLILATATRDAVVVGADRRLTANDRVVDEESTKLTVFVSPNAKLVVAYTGLARADGFETEKWLLKALSERSSATDIYASLEALRVEAGRALGAVKTAERRLSLLVAGYVYDGNGVAEHKVWRLTNFEHTSASQAPTTEFEMLCEPTSILIGAGHFGAVGADRREALSRVALKGSAAAERMIHHAINEVGGSGTIGRQCNTCILTPYGSDITCTYFSAHPSRTFWGANVAMFGMAAMGVELTTASTSTPLVVPKVRANEPCGCGSGAKYKRCHKGLRIPMVGAFVGKTFNAPPYPPSGREFKVLSRGAIGW